MTGSKKKETMNREFIDEEFEKVVDAFVKNSAYYKWEQKAREITKVNRRLRLERNYEEE